MSFSSAINMYLVKLHLSHRMKGMKVVFHFMMSLTRLEQLTQAICEQKPDSSSVHSPSLIKQ